MWTANSTLFFIQDDVQQFSFDLRTATVSQCPCLALSLSEWLEQRGKKTKNESTSNQCTHHAHPTCHHWISAHTSLAAPPSTDHPSNITLRHAPEEEDFSGRRVERSKRNHPRLSEHIQNNCLILEFQKSTDGKQCNPLLNEKWNYLVMMVMNQIFFIFFYLTAHWDHWCALV